MTEQIISLERLEETINVFGSFDENIRLIEHEMGVTVVSRDAGRGSRERYVRRAGHRESDDPLLQG